MRTLLVTGGAGFIGGNYVLRSLEQDSDLRIVNLDLLTYAGNLDTLESLRDYRLMLEHSHQKSFQSPEEVLQYIDQVLISQLNSIHDRLQTSMDTSLGKLTQAGAHTERLVAKLRIFADGAPDLLP